MSTVSVCAALAARAIGDNLIPIYIDTGLMRKGETERIRTIFANIHLQIVDAGDEFLEALKGITDPEAKRKAIGERFIRVFEREARKQGAKCLLQGTIYPDRIESEGGIKSHHNVGGMPLHMEFTKVIEPIRDLYKDEVREVAGALGLPKEIQHRMPFPGPGLAVRVLEKLPERRLRSYGRQTGSLKTNWLKSTAHGSVLPPCSVLAPVSKATTGSMAGLLRSVP